MSILSTVTGSLPNLLEYVQGKWNIEYKNKIPLSQEDREKAMESIKNTDPLNPIGTLWSFNNILSLMQTGWKELDFDSFVEMNEIDDTTITNNPVEKGSFRSVNKVVKPKIIKVTIAKAGIGEGIIESLSEVKRLLPKARYEAEKVMTSIQLAESLFDEVVDVMSGKKSSVSFPKIISIPMEFRITTPYETIEKLNLIKLDYTFKQDTGRNMLLMYLTFQEMIERSATTKSKEKTPKNPTDFPKLNVGSLSLQQSGGSALDQAFSVKSSLL